MIKLVAFDWNGTLLADTMPAVEADNVVFVALGARPITVHQFRETFDVPFLDYYAANGVSRALFLKRQERLNELFHEAYEARAARTRTRSGARQLLQSLSDKGILQIIFSNHTYSGIQFQLERLNLAHYFSRVLARDDLSTGTEQRHKGLKLGRYIKAKRYRKSEVLIVGDTIEEVEIAQTLGVKSIAITGGFCSAARLKSVRPNFLIHNLTELEKIIKKLNQ